MRTKLQSPTLSDDQPTQSTGGSTSIDEQYAEPLAESQAFTDRWWLAAPGHDESLRSLVERADRLYGKPPSEGYVWQNRTSGEGAQHLDAPTSLELARLARMLGVNPRYLHAHRLEDGPHLLEMSERRAYCPQCFKEDNAAGRPRIFRRAWARVMAVSCSEHGLPLHWAEPRLAAEVNFGVDPSPFVLAKEDLEVLRLIDRFARTLEACLWGHGIWPGGWRGTAHAARALLIRCLCNLFWQPRSLPIAQLWISSSLQSAISFPLRSMPPLCGVPWESVRRIGRPSWRRAALWLVAAQVVPGLPEQWRPETIPAAYLAAVDQWWDDFPPSPHTQKLWHVYGSLRRLCVPFLIDQMRFCLP